MNKLLDFEDFLLEIDSPSTPPELSWRPIFLRLSPGEFERLAEVCAQRHIRVIDTLERQLADLAMARLPAAQLGGERKRFIEDSIAAHGEAACYGNWAYLPWEQKIVHLLDQDAFFEVITNRNQEKITREEQQELRKKRVGVIGLSVGGEAAVAVAQEHLCGAMVLADFDRLDLSNLNRLNAGVDELGFPKSSIIARRIARIDPYLEISVFDEGVTPANAAEFVAGLDLIIEECDALQVKRDIRILAKARGINLVYAADERGFLSVEPYPFHPELLPFHGRAEQPQQPRESFPTPLAFMEALSLWMGGWDNLSERSQRSLRLIGTSLCGYPQLAGEARYAAGQVAHVARRLLLGERLPPFLRNLDLAELLPGTDKSR